MSIKLNSEFSCYKADTEALADFALEIVHDSQSQKKLFSTRELRINSEVLYFTHLSAL